jgi:hypothetical protein
VLATFAKGMNAARPVPFEEQLIIFSQRVQPLCWMAVPDWLPSRAGLDLPWLQHRGQAERGAPVTPVPMPVP